MQAELCKEAATPDLTMPLATSRRTTVFSTGTRSMSALADAKRMAATHTTCTMVAKQTGSSTENHLLINFLRESANPLQPSNCADAPYQIYARKCIKLLYKTAEQKCVVIVRQIHLAYNEPIREPSAEEIKRHMTQIDRSRPATIQEKHPLVEYSP